MQFLPLPSGEVALRSNDGEGSKKRHPGSSGMPFKGLFCAVRRYDLEVDPSRYAGGPCVLFAQPAELLAHMVRALTVAEGRRAILDLNVDDVIADLIQIVVILVEGERLGDAAAKINEGGKIASRLVLAAVREKRDAGGQQDDQGEDQVFLPRLPGFFA